MHDVIKKLDMLLGNPKRNFLTGENPSIADLLIFFELTNLWYYNDSHDKYENVKEWFKNVYNIPEVKKITHEWHPIAQQFAEFFKTV